MTYLILYLCCALVLFPLDVIWLSTAGRTLYRREIGALLSERPNLAVALLFYLAYLAGVVVLVAAPAQGDVVKALWTGAVLGLTAYGTYDLTNLATLRGYTTRIAVIDLAWGTFVTAVAAAGGVWIAGLLT
jgi:uncharacterized membrane protein